MLVAQRTHEFCYGHRVAGHENKCANLHGHNAQVCFSVYAANGLDKVGRVLDFSVIKSTLCQWLEDNWDHKFLMWEEDPMLPHMPLDNSGMVIVPFNPTAENMASYLLHVVGPAVLPEGVGLGMVKFWETGKCSVVCSRRF